jgi:hypothetical protein
MVTSLPTRPLLSCCQHGATRLDLNCLKYIVLAIRIVIPALSLCGSSRALGAPCRGLLISELVWSKPRPAAARFGGPHPWGAWARPGGADTNAAEASAARRTRIRYLPVWCLHLESGEMAARRSAGRANAPWCGGQIEMNRPRPHSGPRFDEDLMKSLGTLSADPVSVFSPRSNMRSGFGGT